MHTSCSTLYDKTGFVLGDFVRWARVRALSRFKAGEAKRRRAAVRCTKCIFVSCYFALRVVSRREATPL